MSDQAIPIDRTTLSEPRADEGLAGPGSPRSGGLFASEADACGERWAGWTLDNPCLLVPDVLARKRERDHAAGGGHGPAARAQVVPAKSR
jgi:hypothetical protein